MWIRKREDWGYGLWKKGSIGCGQKVGEREKVVDQVGNIQEGVRLHSKCNGPAAGPEKLAHCRTGVKGPITGEKGPES